MTTTGSTHDLKFHESPLLQPGYKKAPSSWKVQYVEDSISTVGFSLIRGFLITSGGYIRRVLARKKKFCQLNVNWEIIVTKVPCLKGRYEAMTYFIKKHQLS